MKKLFFLGIVLVLFLVYGLYLTQYDFLAIEEHIQIKNPEGYYDYKGVTHSHSKLSTGSSSQEQINRAAKKSGLDFIIHTELNYFGDELRKEGYYERLLVLQGNEYSYLDSHMLVYKQKFVNSLSGLGETQVYFADQLSRGLNMAPADMIVLAHPYKDANGLSLAQLSGVHGIETLNLKSIWQNYWTHSKLSFLWSGLIYPFNSRLALLRLYLDPEKEVDLWDKLNESQITFGFVGNDSTAHLSSIGEGFFRFPSYEESFSIASNHVLLTSELTGDFDSDKEKILRALTTGQFYQCMDFLGNPKGFIAEVRTSTTTYLSGSKIPVKEHPLLYIKLPRTPKIPYEIRLIRNGQLIEAFNEPEIQFKLSKPGIYRIVVRVIPTLPLPDGRRWFSWIFSNPFFIE